MEILGLTADQWFNVGISTALVVGTALIARWLLRYLLDRILARLLGERGKQFSQTLLRPVRTPLSWIAVLVALQVALQRLDFLVSEDRAADLHEAFFVLYVFVGFVFVARLASSLLTWYGKEVAPRTESEIDDQLLPFARRVMMILLTIIGLIILLSHFEIDVSGLVATLGIGSLAIALAAQASLADTISGFIIMVDRPYRIGDRIEISDLDTWGDVIDIGLRSSRIRTRDNRMVIVPNSVMSKSLIVNYSYPDTRYRIQIELGVAYGTDIELARQTMIEAVQDVEGVLPDRPVEALFLHFGDSAMIFRVRWWLESYQDTRRMFDRVNTALLRKLTEAGIELPAPQRELHHRLDDKTASQLASAMRTGA